MHATEPSDSKLIDDHWLGYAHRLRAEMGNRFWSWFSDPFPEITRRIRRATLAFLRPLEALVRNVLLIRAAGLAMTLAPLPEKPRAAGANTKRWSTEWARPLSFQLIAPARQPMTIAIASVGHQSRMVSAVSLRRRIAALDRVLKDHRAVIERFARRLQQMKARRTLPNFDYVRPHRELWETFGEGLNQLMPRVMQRVFGYWRSTDEIEGGAPGIHDSGNAEARPNP